MTEDKFLKFINDYSSKGNGAIKAKSRRNTRNSLLVWWGLGLLLSIAVPAFFLLWIPYSIFLFFYAMRENMF
jgi:hypothetical protein